LKGRIFLVGRLCREDVYSLINTADIGFVFYNGLMGDEAADPAPNKLSDYVAGNIWTIGGNQHYMKYWLEQRVAGICINEISKENIAAAINKILTENRFKNRKILADIYEQELNMDAQAGKLLSLVNKVCVA
jgi:hypothetical protein